MTAVAVHTNVDQQHPHEYSQQSPQLSHRRPNHSLQQSPGAPSQPYAQATTPQHPSTSHTPPPSDAAVRASGKSAGINARKKRSANGASVSNTSDIMSAQQGLGAAASGQRTNGAPKGSSVNAGRRNQSSANLTNGNGANRTAQVEATNSRRPPQLQRSKSDYGPRGEEPEELDEGSQDWGARHGFDGHYASDEFVSQLVHVSDSLLVLVHSMSAVNSCPRL